MNYSLSESNVSKKIDPLRRVFVPIVFRGRFKTTDGEAYRVDSQGVTRRVSPKVNGKVARKLRAKARQD